MPYKHEWETNGFYIKLWGHVTSSDIEARNRTFSNDFRSDTCQYQILDGRHIESLDIARSDITQMASNDIGMSYRLKEHLMILVSANPDVQEAFRQYVIICQKTDIKWSFLLCDTLYHAREWLSRLKAFRTKRHANELPPQADHSPFANTRI